MSGSTVETVGTEVPAELRPPRTVTPTPLATTEERETAAGSSHGSTPASMDEGPVDFGAEVATTTAAFFGVVEPPLDRA